MAGEFQPANVKVVISKLKEERRLIRGRYWQRPDQFIMSKEEYVKLFPNDEYDNETDSKSWIKEKQVVEKKDSTKENSKFEIPNSNFSPGFYVIEVSTKDKDGQEVKDVKYVELYDEKVNNLGHPEYLWTEESKPIEPGEKTSIKIGTSSDNVYLIQQIDKETTDDGPQIANCKLQIARGQTTDHGR